MRMCRQIALVMCCGSVLSATAFGAPPAALDRVPADAAVTIVIPNLQNFLNETKSFGKDILPAEAVLQMNMGLALAQTFLDMPGMDANGSAAAVMYVEDDMMGGMEPPMVVLLPVSDFKSIREALGASGSGPVYGADMNGTEIYMKDVGGGFIALGPIPELVQEFSGAAGNMPSHASRLGKNGQTVLDGSDVSVMLNVEKMSPMIRQAATGMAEQAEMVMMMAGDQAAQMKPMMDMMLAAMNHLADDGEAAVFGAQMDASGLTLHQGMNFREGTPSAQFFAAGGNSGPLLDKLPASNFLFAYAMDSSNGSLRQMFEAVSKMSAGMPGLGGMDMASMMANSKGMAGAMGTVPMMGAGLFSNMVQVTAANNGAQMMGDVSKMMKSLDGQSIEGMKYAVVMEEAAVKIGGVDVSKFGLSMQPDGTGDADAFGPAAMVLPMLFGPSGGPNGFMANVDGMIVQTMSQNTPLMEKAIAAAKSGGGLGSTDALKGVASKLPSSRVFEMYLGIDQIINTVGPMASTFGVLPAFEPMPVMAPVGIGIGTGDRGMHGAMHLPKDVIKSVVALAQTMEDAGFEEEPAPAGRPRF